MRRIARRLAIVTYPDRLALAALMLAGLAIPAEAKTKLKRPVYAPPQAAMVIDGHTGKVLHASNADAARFPASIAKVMTLYLLFERLRDGRLTLDTPLNVSATAAAQPPSKLALAPGKTITVREAIYALVTKSANDCAAVVAENLAGSEEEFARLMTTRARALGMTNTVFRNASGLPDPAQRTTARDLITLGRRVLADFPDQASVFRTRFFSYNGESYRNHNGLLFSYEGTEGLKTGFTQASGFNLLTSVRRGNKHLVAVVLGGRSAIDRNSRMRSLLNSAWSRAADGSKVKGSPALVAESKARPAPALAVAAAAGAGSEMPERNPAFHSTVTERSIKVAMAIMLELDREGPASEGVPKSQDEAEQQEAEASSAAAETADEANPGVVMVEPPVELAGSKDILPVVAGPEQGDTAASAAAALLVTGPYQIQVGSYANVEGAKSRLQNVSAKAGTLLDGHGELTIEGSVAGKSRYRARFGKFSETEAKDACGKLKQLAIDCMVVRAE